MVVHHRVQIDTWVSGPRLGGMYEILEDDSTLKLLDIKGETAIFRKLQRVKFLQDHIIAFQDYAWGDGDILLTIAVHQGLLWIAAKKATVGRS